jgi:predicted XRE-type DNA-binding protein
MAKKQLFSEQLRLAIKRSEMTRYRISLQTGIAQSILSRFLNHGAGLSMDSVDKLIECLDLMIVPRNNPSSKKRKGK